MKLRRFAVAAVALGVATVASSAFAQEEEKKAEPAADEVPVTEAAPDKPAAAAAPAAAADTGALRGDTANYDLSSEVKDNLANARNTYGWELLFKLNGGGSILSNANVIGTVPGETFTLQANIDFSTVYHHGAHEWRGSFFWGEGYFRTPGIDAWLKSQDEMRLDTTYLYYVVDWFGPFVNARMNTRVFPTIDARSGTADYVVTNADGSVTNLTADRFDLAGFWSPLQLRQAVGLFARPLRKVYASLEFRAGVGMQEVFADGAYAITAVTAGATPTGSTATVAINELSSFNQAGGDFSLVFWGSTMEKRITYRAYAETLVPFWDDTYDSATDPNSLPYYATFEGGVAADFFVFEWLKAGYVFRVVRQPRLLDDFQFQNLLTISFNYTLAKDWTTVKPIEE